MCKMHEAQERESASAFCQNHESNRRVLVVLGGDARQLAVSAFLAEAGYSVRCMGFGEADAASLAHDGELFSHANIKIYHHIGRALEGCHGIVLPYPVTKDGLTVHCPLDPDLKISLKSLEEHQEKHPRVILFGGRIPEGMKQNTAKWGGQVVDYEDSEAFLLKNARLTAEGAVMTAMQLTDSAVLGEAVAILGYGRIGQLLGQLLTSWGAQVTVFARRQESRALAEAQGCRAISFDELSSLTEGYDMIFNTVPSKILDRSLLIMLPCRTLIIELASSPGGLDPEGAREAAHRCGLQIVHAPALPGRYAPRNAGKAIAALIEDVLGTKATEEGREVIP